MSVQRNTMAAPFGEMLWQHRSTARDGYTTARSDPCASATTGQHGPSTPGTTINFALSAPKRPSISTDRFQLLGGKTRFGRIDDPLQKLRYAA